jgi:hypothetical protein
MNIPVEKKSRIWRRLYPDMYIWINPETNETVEIRGSREKGYYNVKRTVPNYEQGIVSTYTLSPFYVLPVKPIGMVGTEANLAIRSRQDSKPGTFGDALRFAINYMKRREKKGL